MGKNIKDAVKTANDAIKLAINTMAGDQSVYNTAKSMDDYLKSIAEALGTTYKLDTTDNKVTAAENNMRAYLGAAVKKYLADNKAKFEGQDCRWQDRSHQVYLTFGTAVEKALNDGGFMKSLEAAYTEAAYAQLYADLADSLQKEYDKFVENQDSDFIAALNQYGPLTNYLTTKGPRLRPSMAISSHRSDGSDAAGKEAGLDAGVKIPTIWTCLFRILIHATEPKTQS